MYTWTHRFTYTHSQQEREALRVHVLKALDESMYGDVCIHARVFDPFCVYTLGTRDTRIYTWIVYGTRVRCKQQVLPE